VVSKRRPRDFKFGTQVDRIYSPSIRPTNHPWKGRGYVTWLILNLRPHPSEWLN